MQRMKRFATLAAIVFLVPAVAQARPKHFYEDWKWWAGESVIIAAVALDGHSTCQGFNRGLVENNFLARGSTSCGRTAGSLVAGAGFYTALHLLDRKYVADGQSRVWDFLGYTEVPIVACAIHCTAAAHNYSLNGTR